MNDVVKDDKIILQARELDKSFDTFKKPIRVLSKAELEIKTGELLGIIGASGVGKSTLLHILGGLDRPSGGHVFFKGKDIFQQGKGYLETFRNARVGFIFQFFNLLNEFSVLENTMFPALIGNSNLKETKEKGKELLAEVGLKDRMGHKPGELSGGESQRVALARALINKPEMILADEPTGNLDIHSSDHLMALIRKLNSDFKQTFVIVTHSQRLARSLDRVLQLSEGKVSPIEKEFLI